jgi:N-acetyl-anhydromuramyl-L-alanine amidase AmpD
MEIKQDLTPINFTPRRSREIKGVVLHSMAGTQAGSIAWFKNPASQASAHYCISKDGEIVQTCLDKDVAWHAGIFDEPLPQAWLYPNPNQTLISIECEDCRDANWPYPEPQRQALRWLLDYLSKKWGFENSTQNVFLHKNLNPSRRSDPVGNFSFEWLYNESMNLDDKIPDDIKTEFNLSAYGEFNNNEETWRTFIEKWKEYVTRYNRAKDEDIADDKVYEEKLSKKEDELIKCMQDLEKTTQIQEQLQTLQLALKGLEDKVANKTEVIAGMSREATQATLRINTLEADVEVKSNEINRLNAVVDQCFDKMSWKVVWELILSKLGKR